MLSCGNRSICSTDPSRRFLPLVENEKSGQDDAAEARGVIPLYFFAEIENRESREDRECDDLLNGLELRGGELVRANAIRRDLEAVFEECDAPAYEDYFPKSSRAKLEVAVPGKSHEDVRDGEQEDGSHVLGFSLCCEMCFT